MFTHCISHKHQVCFLKQQHRFSAITVLCCHPCNLTPTPCTHTCRLISSTETTLESSLLQEEVEEEEVWLYWIDSHKEPHGKSIRHLAQDAKGTHKMDVDIITYYR